MKEATDTDNRAPGDSPQVNGEVVYKSALAAKLARVMANVGGIPKDRENTAQHYKYRSEDAVMERIRTLLSDEGVAVLPAVVDVKWLDPIPTRNGSMSHVQIMLMVSFVDSESGEREVVTMVGTGADSGDKAIYKAITGATKYVFTKMFCISEGDDAEADARVDDAVNSKAAPKTITDEDASAVANLLSKIQEYEPDFTKKYMRLLNVTEPAEITVGMLPAVMKQLAKRLEANKAKAENGDVQ